MAKQSYNFMVTVEFNNGDIISRVYNRLSLSAHSKLMDELGDSTGKSIEEICKKIKSVTIRKVGK